MAGKKRQSATVVEAKSPAMSQPSTSLAIAEAVLEFDEETLPLAAGKLFELNNYAVEYGRHIHGAEVDIVATPKGVPYPQTIYIEATVQYVDNTKYGKDLTKFSLIREVDPNARCVCLSSKGFTADVRERAAKTRIITQTYADLFSEFEKFHPYVESVVTNPDNS